MINVLLLGSTGALGRSVADLLQINDKIALTVVVRDVTHSSKEAVYWNYRDKIPESFKSADVIINCARSKDFNFNRSFNRLLIRSLPASVKLINISSNAVFARPNGLMIGWLFKGDAYIREKKYIEKLSVNRGNTFILRPTIVVDEGGWLLFLKSCKFAGVVIAPAGGEVSHVRVTKRVHVARTIESYIFGDLEVPHELYESIDSVREMIGRQLIFSNNSNNYFDNSIKNILMVVLCSWAIPDRLAFILQRLAISRIRPTGSSDKSSELVVDGMTRLYLFGDHTK